MKLVLFVNPCEMRIEKNWKKVVEKFCSNWGDLVLGNP